MRQHAPSTELRRVAGLPCTQEHETDGEIRRKSEGGFQREVSLLDALGVEVQVRFQTALLPRHGLVFVDVNFEQVLRPKR